MVSRRIQDEHGAEFLAFAGNRPLPGGISAVCFGQMARENPRLAATTHTYLHLNGWLAFHLTGEKYFDTANACFTGVYPTVTAGHGPRNGARFSVSIRAGCRLFSAATTMPVACARTWRPSWACSPAFRSCSAPPIPPARCSLSA